MNMQALKSKIMNNIPTNGTTIGNMKLFLKIKECNHNIEYDEYLSSIESLKDEGKIKIGKGRGGSVRLSNNSRVKQISRDILQLFAGENSSKIFTNKQARESLGLTEQDDESLYWAARDMLIEEGKIIRGVGRGGTIRTSDAPVGVGSTLEKDLWEPLGKSIEGEWMIEAGYPDDSFVTHQLARQGRNSSGTWSRPDICIFSLKMFEYSLPRFEITTFEVKNGKSIDVQCVYEALGHSRYAHYSYVLLEVKDGFENVLSEKLISIESECIKHGLGMITFSDPEKPEEWNTRVFAKRIPPEPERVDEFFAKQKIPQHIVDAIKLWFKKNYKPYVATPEA